MKLVFVTLFPEIIERYIQHSIFARSCKKGLITVQTVNIRDFAEDKHNSCDDTPYGGGSGMLLMPEPLHGAIQSVKTENSHVVFPTPVAPLFTQNDARLLSQRKEIIFICGRYEGIDQRIIDLHVDNVYSLGEYVLSSGELAALVMSDAIYRLIDGVITQNSLTEESYTDALLEYPQYTKPSTFEKMTVPEVLLSGNHRNIQEWRLRQRCEQTKRYRPDMYKKYLEESHSSE